MARPQKNGLEYFPLDVNNDDKLDFIEAEFGLKGWAVIIKLWAKIYENGYFYKWTEDEKLLFQKRINLCVDEIDKVVIRAIEREIFDKRCFEEYQILTSNGIQKRYFEAIKRRKEITVVNEYLINDHINSFKGNINYVNVDNNSINVDNNPQSKVKESKVNNNGLNPTAFKLTCFCIAQILKNHPNLKFNDQQKHMHANEIDKLMRIDGYSQEDIRAAIEWITSQTKKGKNGFCWADQFRSPAKLRKKDSDGHKYISVWLDMANKDNNSKTNNDIPFSKPETKPWEDG